MQAREWERTTSQKGSSVGSPAVATKGLIPEARRTGSEGGRERRLHND